MAQFESYQNGQTSLDPFIKVMVYDDRFNNKTSEVITLRAERNEWQRIMMSQQRFQSFSKWICRALWICDYKR